METFLLVVLKHQLKPDTRTPEEAEEPYTIKEKIKHFLMFCLSDRFKYQWRETDTMSSVFIHATHEFQSGSSRLQNIILLQETKAKLKISKLEL